MTGISIKNIAELHPALYHMAEHGTWDSIKQHGLLTQPHSWTCLEFLGRIVCALKEAGVSYPLK